MTIEVLLFASLADRAGTSKATVDLEPGSDVSRLWEVLLQRYPGLREHRPRPVAACDLTYAAWDRALDDVREVAFLPPVSGG